MNSVPLIMFVTTFAALIAGYPRRSDASRRSAIIRASGRFSRCFQPFRSEFRRGSIIRLGHQPNIDSNTFIRVYGGYFRKDKDRRIIAQRLS